MLGRATRLRSAQDGTEEFPLSATRIQPNYAWFIELKVRGMQFQINWFFLHLWMPNVSSLPGVYKGTLINKAKRFHLNLEPAFTSIVKSHFKACKLVGTRIYFFRMYFLNSLFHLLYPVLQANSIFFSLIPST
jgi:hypothetical protein